MSNWNEEPPGYGSAPPWRPGGEGPGNQGHGEQPPWTGQGTYAGYWSRVGGYLLDGIIVGIISLVILLPMHAWHTYYTTSSSGTRLPHLQLSGGALLLQAAVLILYATAFLGSSRGQTPGMMAARIRLVSANGGAPIGYGRALVRSVIAYVLGILFVVPLLIDLLWPIWDRNKQTLHDKAVQSVVVRV